MISLTVACPTEERKHGDDLAVYLGTRNGSSPEEWAKSFDPVRRDAKGNVWHVMSVLVSETFIEAHIESLFQVPGLVIWMPQTDPEAELAIIPTALENPTRIIAVVGMAGIDALVAMGLSPIPEEEVGNFE